MHLYNKMMLSIFLAFVLLINYVHGQNTSLPQILVTKLIHYQSVNSPFYDPTRSIEELAEISITSSISRGRYLTANDSLLHPTDIDSQLIPAQEYGFLAHLTVGSEDLDQFVYMDTGSDLLWINCDPTDSNVPSPLFNPKKSTSYRVENCDSGNVCDGTGNVIVDCEDYSYDVDGCKYRVQYVKGLTSGYLGRETFKFGRIKTETLNDIVFGCAGRTNLYINGMLGLGSRRITLLSQYNTSKFSYCFGDISDRSYAYNELVIGDKVQLWGSVTPLIIDSRFYINLEGITIGNTPLAFDPKIFKKWAYGGGMLVDTGMSYTFIPQVVLTTFQAAIIKAMGYRLPRRDGVLYDNTVPRLCYGGVVARDLKWFPDVKLQFQYGAIMLLTPDNIFQQYNATTICLAILPSDHLGTTISILGNLMQQNFYVAYDLSRMKLSFKRMNCKDVEDYYAHDEL